MTPPLVSFGSSLSQQELLVPVTLVQYDVHFTCACIQTPMYGSFLVIGRSSSSLLQPQHVRLKEHPAQLSNPVQPIKPPV